MSSYDLYSTPVATGTWNVPMTGAARLSWEYDGGRDRLLALYQKGKDKQWDAGRRIDWDRQIDPLNAAGLPAQFKLLFGSDLWNRMSQRDRDEVDRHHGSWLFSQFLHGEQGALTVAARIVESVPDQDSKFYAATQVMDEARHMELFSRFVHDKIGMYYPVNQDLAALLDQALRDSRWDLPYLGMQVLIEGLALAAFGLYRDMATAPLVKQLLAFVMQDEARHVAFGRLVLKDYYAQLTSKERAEREEFVIEGSYLMRDRFTGREIFETLDLPLEECIRHVENSELITLYRSLLFGRIVPVIRDIGLWSDQVRSAYADMGVLDHAKADLVSLMRQDEDIADRYDAQRADAELRLRKAEVDEAVELGAQS
ncbi:ferritin-like domain-containing protein [Streptomyces sp. NPDC101209]|uniref:ferritin-like domain-containing protein n=1 Tax=Streptomyces sp. NPDC101209 TaxID=3366129 RepID=UPI003819AF1A